MPEAKTLIDKIWEQHVIRKLSDGRTLLRIDRHIVHEVTSREAFDRLRQLNLRVRNPNLSFSVIDHKVSTLPERTGETFEPAREWIHVMRDNCREFGLDLYDVDDTRQGICHVIGPEIGITIPGCTLVCGDSHTPTNGALGVLAWGIGTTEVMHVLATQSLLQCKPKHMRITFQGTMGRGVFAKDLILYVIGKHGTAAGTGFAVEYAGPAIRALPVEGRLTICNMSGEFGARMGIIAPDDETIAYVAGRPYAPQGELWEKAVSHWRTLYSDTEVEFDREIDIDCDRIRPQVTWGNSPQDVGAIDDLIPDPATVANLKRRRMIEQALSYMDLKPGRTMEGIPIDYAFIGSCTNGRLSDLGAAAEVLRGRKVADGVKALVVPGSMKVKLEAEAKGLDKIFIEAGFEWRNPGCSTCVAANGDVVAPGNRSISTTNRNFENRQGPKSRTHLASPAMVAAAAVSGRITDVRKLLS
jgi:3-isopropylmalate/(R)-2-methylmalate dehydratase large subunit